MLHGMKKSRARKPTAVRALSQQEIAHVEGGGGQGVETLAKSGGQGVETLSHQVVSPR
jgi:hypothetical protein